MLSDLPTPQLFLHSAQMGKLLIPLQTAPLHVPHAMARDNCPQGVASLDLAWGLVQFFQRHWTQDGKK